MIATERGQNPAKLRFGVFIFDPSAGSLTTNGDDVKIAPRVLDCLVLLISGSSRIIRKDEFFAAVWKESFVEDNALAYTISQLRKTLAEYDPETTYIETVPKRGFRFVAEISEISATDIAEKAEITVERHTIEEVWIQEAEDPKKLILSGRKSKRLFGLTVAAVFVLLILGSLAAWRWGKGKTAASIGDIRSIAILPLQSFENQDADDPLQMQMTDSLITRLGGIGMLSVRPTNSVRLFKASNIDPLQFGKDLEVDAILEGRIQREADRLRVNLQLVSVNTGEQFWAEQFDGRSDKLLELQDAISISLIKRLQLRLTSSDQRSLARKPTLNSDAYDKYLLGRYHWNTRTEEGFLRSIEYFQQSVTLDPEFAEAHAGIADAYLGLYDYGVKQADDSLPRARASINRAIQLNPNSAETYSTLSAIQFLYDRDFEAAEKSILRSLEINPLYATAHLRYGWILTMKGRFEDARSELEKVRGLDPTSSILHANIGYLHLSEGKIEEAENEFFRVISMSPDFSLPYWYLGGISFTRGDRDKMFEYYLKAFELDNGVEAVRSVRVALQDRGPDEALRLWQKSLENIYKEKYIPPSNIALIAALRRDREKTIYWLTEADKKRDPWLLQIKYDHEYDFVRDDPRFKKIIEGFRF